MKVNSEPRAFPDELSSLLIYANGRHFSKGSLKEFPEGILSLEQR